MSANQPLITKYRPLSFDEVVGHTSVMAALRKAIRGDTTPHAYMLTGPAGLGKTTTARIIAKELDAEPLEIDAASNNGVDPMRELVEMGNHQSLSGKGRRAFIIDECHTLSKPAWQALLKLLEEPPEHLYLMLCTTELSKVPDTILSRCYHVVLRPLKPEELGDLLTTVAELEDWPVAADVMQAVLQSAEGSPRKALSLLQAVHDAPNRDEVKRIINLMDASDPMHELCKLVIAGAAWVPVQQVLARIGDDEFEHASNMLARYLLAVMNSAKNEDGAKRAWQALDALLFPAASWDRKAAFYAAIGRMRWA